MLGLLVSIIATIIEIIITEWFIIPTKGVEGDFFHPHGTVLQHADYIVFSIYTTIILASFNVFYFIIIAFINKKSKFAIISYITYAIIILIFTIYIVTTSNTIITVTNQG